MHALQELNSGAEGIPDEAFGLPKEREIRMRWPQLRPHVEKLMWTASALSAVVGLVGFVSGFLAFGSMWIFPVIRANAQLFWMLTLSLAGIVLWIRTSRLNRQFTSGLKDDFNGDLQAKWDFVGRQWGIVEQGQLHVGGARTPQEDGGGISKVGAHWENYTFSFEARIMNECLGVIVRAKDLNNYYMFQIRTDRIRPHRRAEIPLSQADPPGLVFASPDQEQQTPVFRPISFAVGWDTSYPGIPLNCTLDGWFSVRVNVRGESVRLYIDDELVFHQDSFLRIPTGKVGFRNSGEERALVKRVRVTLEQ